MIHFVLDYRSPYAYLANTQITALGAQITYEPVDILRVMEKVNNQPSPMCPPKAKYAALDATRWAKLYRVPFAPNWALLEALRNGRCENALFSRAGIAGQRLGIFEQVINALFSAVWAGSDDLGECRRTVAIRHKPRAAGRIVGDGGVCRGRGEPCRQQRACGGARAYSACQPSSVDDEMFFGNDRLDFIKARLKPAYAKVPGRPLSLTAPGSGVAVCRAAV